MLSRGFVCDGNLVKLDGGQARQSGYGDESISPVVEMEDGEFKPPAERQTGQN